MTAGQQGERSSLVTVLKLPRGLAATSATLRIIALTASFQKARLLTG